MRFRMDLFAYDDTVAAPDRRADAWFNMRAIRFRDGARPLKGLHHIANRKRLDGLSRPVGHPDQRADFAAKQGNLGALPVEHGCFVLKVTERNLGALGEFPFECIEPRLAIDRTIDPDACVP